MLDRLDANLRAEQRSFAELDFLMFTQLLTPIQARVHCQGTRLRVHCQITRLRVHCLGCRSAGD